MNENSVIVRSAADLAAVDFARRNGVVIVVAQDADTGRVLMVAEADHEALSKTLETGDMWYRSRTRGLWHKGATSGHFQHLVELRLDCDHDTLLALVRPAGPACHTGATSCFGEYDADYLARLDSTIAARATDESAKSSYTRQLLSDRNRRLKKLGEESVELAVACGDGDAAAATTEAADVLYHVAVALHGAGSSLAAARAELAVRAHARSESPDGSVG